MSSKRFEGKNLEEAIDSAAKSFGVESFRVSYHVVLEKRGFLGGTKRVVIEAEVSGAAPSPAEKKPEREREKKADRPARSARPAKSERPGRGDRPATSDRPARQQRPARSQPQENEARPDRNQRAEPAEQSQVQESSHWQFDEPSGDAAASDPDARSARSFEELSSSGDRKRPPHDRTQDGGGRNSRRRGRRGRGGRGGRGGNQPQEDPTPTQPAEPRAAEPVVPMEIPEQGEQSPEAASVSQWCETIFTISGLDLVARTVDRDEEVSVEIFGPDLGAIVDASDYLDSLQVLANKAFTGRSIERRIELDAAGFKQRREGELAERAREMADQVRKEGRERTMRAMSPIERRIVHLALEDDLGVTTESRGRGFHKRVAILPADEERPVAEES